MRCRGKTSIKWNCPQAWCLPCTEWETPQAQPPLPYSKSIIPPGCTIEAHTHDCDYTEIILEGSQRVGATWHAAGDIRIGLANRGYGPLVAGPEGAWVLFVFASGAWPAIKLGNNDGSTLGSDLLEAHFDKVQVAGS